MGALVFAALVSLPCAAAAPRDFPFTWTSKTLTAGRSSVEGWVTPRFGKVDETYFRVDYRLSWNHGVTKNVESQLSVDLDWLSSERPQRLDPKVSSLWRWTTWREGSPFAVGGLGRVSVGLGLFEMEARLFADLRIDRVLFALNASASRALFWGSRDEIDTRLEESFALKFALSNHASVGLEVRAKSSWAKREYQGTALFVGPTLSFTHQYFWVTFGGYAQVAADKANADRALAEPNELRDNERFMLRLAFGENT